MSRATGWTLTNIGEGWNGTNLPDEVARVLRTRHEARELRAVLDHSRQWGEPHAMHVVRAELPEGWEWDSNRCAVRSAVKP